MLSQRGAPRDSPSGSPWSETTAREEPSSRVDVRADDLKSGARDANGDESASAAERTSETACDDSVSASSDSLLDIAVQRIVLDIDGRGGALSFDPTDARAAAAADADAADARRVGTEPELPPTLGALERRIASLPPDLAQMVFDALVEAKRLGVGGVSLARQFKYLWFVDLAACGDVAEDDVVETLLATNARTLLRLSVARCARLTEASMRSLECRHAFPVLTYLDLSECASVTDETLSCVARAPNLETLKAEGCAIVGGGLRHVAKLEKLKHLSLERCGRLGGAMPSVPVDVDDVDDAHPVGPVGLAETSVEHAAHVSGLANAAPRAAKKRRTDEAGGPGVDADASSLVGVPALAALTTLETLNLGWCNRVSDRDVSVLGSLKALKKLVLARTQAGAGAAIAVRRLPNLIALDLTGTPFDDTALALLAGEFDRGGDLIDGPYGESTATVFHGPIGPIVLPELRELSLEATRVTGDAGGCIARGFAGSLTGLNAAFTEMSDAGVRELRAARLLRAVNLDSCPVGDAAATALASLPDLESVTLADTDVGNDGVEALARGAKRLTHLDLGHTLVDDDGVAHLRFAKLTLKSLSLDSRSISDRGVLLISDLRALESLDLFAAEITDAGVFALRDMRELRSLEMCGGRVTDVGVARVARFCANLETLNLGQNARVTDRGADAVAASLKKLTALNLTGSQVTDVGAKKFAALKRLTTLALKECRGVTRAAARYLRERCPKLTEVSFGSAEALAFDANPVDHPTDLNGPNGPVAIAAPVVPEDVADELAAELAAENADASETDGSDADETDEP